LLDPEKREAEKKAKRKRKHDKPIEHKTTGKGKTYNPTEKALNVTAKGRAETMLRTAGIRNRQALNPKTKKDQGRKDSFCARMEGVVKNAKGPAERAKASLKNWNC
jgi:hypothetical protein